MKTRMIVAVMLSSIVLSACATPDYEKEVKVPPAQMKKFLADKPAKTRRLFAKVLTQGGRNVVLNDMRSGLAALQVGADTVAADAFDHAIGGITTIYADNKRAKKARSLWIKEDYKDFKGEPYERAMAFYYRGLLYLREGDYDNARASFLGGLTQYGYAPKHKYAEDFPVLDYLAGWASKCDGEPGGGKDLFKEAHKLNAALTTPSKDANLLLVAETGKAPRKIAKGQYKQALAFARGTGFDDEKASFALGDQKVAATMADDIYRRASTRGGRQIDVILDGQAKFKKDANVAGNVMVTAGATTAMYGAYSGNRDAALAGGAMALVGLLAKGIAAATRPEADVRAWDNLPDKVHVTALHAEPMPSKATATFLSKAGSVVGTQTFTIKSAGACSIGWVRAHSALDVPDAAPGSTSSPPAARSNGQQATNTVEGF